MLNNLDLSKKIAKTQYQNAMDELEIQAGQLQRQAHHLGIPIIILFEGWDAAGKGTLINRLALSLDSRGFVVHPINPPNEEERLRPFLWRFWTKLPPKEGSPFWTGAGAGGSWRTGSTRESKKRPGPMHTMRSFLLSVN